LYWSQNFKLFGFPVFRFWAFLIKVIPETCRATTFNIYVFIYIFVLEHNNVVALNQLIGSQSLLIIGSPTTIQKQANNNNKVVDIKLSAHDAFLEWPSSGTLNQSIIAWYQNDPCVISFPLNYVLYIWSITIRPTRIYK
jgi:hypothetical protein